MNRPSEPTRWRDTPGELHELAEALARGEPEAPGPSAAQRARIWAALEAEVARTHPTGRRAWTNLAKWGAVLLACAASLWAVRTLVGRELPARPEAPAKALRAVSPPPPVHIEDAATPKPPASVPSPSTDNPAQQHAAQRMRTAGGKVRRDSVQPARTARSDPAAELSLLIRARRVLHSDPARTLALTREHEALYPGGAFTEEREVLSIEALLREGKPSEALTRARRFETRFARSAHLPHVHELMQAAQAR